MLKVSWESDSMKITALKQCAVGKPLALCVGACVCVIYKCHNFSWYAKTVQANVVNKTNGNCYVEKLKENARGPLGCVLFCNVVTIWLRVKMNQRIRIRKRIRKNEIKLCLHTDWLRDCLMQKYVYRLRRIYVPPRVCGYVRLLSPQLCIRLPS